MHTLPSARLVFVDNLRVFLTMLVLAHHAAQPYGPTGGAWPIVNSEHAAILGSFFAINAAFFMGLFFFIAGYLTPIAYERKGARRFLLTRFQRLGIPLIFFSLVVFPPVLHHLTAPSDSFLTFIRQTYIHPLKIEVAHLWFLLHLLVYALGYILWQQVMRRRATASEAMGAPWPVPSHQTILAYLLSLTMVTAIVRIDYPIDRWVQLCGFLPTEIAHFPQYVSLFVLGVVAYRYNWLKQMPRRQGFIWLAIGLGAVLLRYGYSISRNGLMLPALIAGGGLDWRSVVWSAWEATICVGLCIGLLVLFREKINSQNKFLQMLADNAYAVYLIHLLLIIYLQVAMVALPIGPLAKFGLVTLIGIPLCFFVSATLRRFSFARLVFP
ncbi:hypothetical protein D0962_28950 [Leptolyngbyaceae cyanobacterium CCMR0082]|uniref:Acyltransferase 3 domain-containing protein n=1 Tax=Adonisia turfae CCMR0082 TaxID=2304604 RepID=A0A6M0SE11_9CYAN|nr:acyltransferase family protein [Adonisia turfae]NEZ66740.1 hypothetical protein [Adonisia turfae CCMR0082]